jgi:hypothetical protein
MTVIAVINACIGGTGPVYFKFQNPTVTIASNFVLQVLQKEKRDDCSDCSWLYQYDIFRNNGATSAMKQLLYTISDLM